MPSITPEEMQRNLDEVLTRWTGSRVQAVPTPPPIAQVNWPNGTTSNVQASIDTIAEQVFRSGYIQSVPTPVNDRVYFSTQSEANGYDSQALEENPIFIDEPERPNHSWPIGTIIKWNLEVPRVKEHLKVHNIQVNLLRVLSYDSSGDIRKVRYPDSIEDESYNVSTKYFIAATPEECAQYEKILSELRQCTERPAIGTVLEYIGISRDLKGKRGVVIGEARNESILFHWFNEVRHDEEIGFNKFRINSSQKHSFVPNPINYCQCASCNSTRLRENIISVEDPSGAEGAHFTFCDKRCANDMGYFSCNCCGHFSEISTMRGDLRSRDGDICQVCFDRYYVQCTSCESNYHRDNLMYNNSLNTYECHYCFDNKTKLIHDHSYRPRFSFQKMAWENTRYLGIELEIECAGDRLNMAKKIKTWLSSHSTKEYVTKEGKTIASKSLDRLIYIKNDGSLRNGIEIVFHPFTLKSFHKNFPLKAFLDYLIANGAIIKENCGMHIHVSKEKLSIIDLLRGKWFFRRTEFFLKKFSERSKYDFCKFDPYDPRPDPYHQEYGHYSVLNYASPDAKTLEIRAFNATLDYKKFLANIQFADVFVDYIQNGVGSVFLRRSSASVIWQSFIDYAKSKNQYHIFTSWILTKGIV